LNDYKDRQKDLRMHQIEWHRKISLSLACLVLFMIGAPLGSIIRKGGVGSPLILSIVFFMVFYFLGTTGEKFAKEGAWRPFYGMWLSTFVLVPIGIFLTYKALRDSQLFSKEFYHRIGRKFRALKIGKRPKRQASVIS
jgi:lipopolysaccharide export system permease protein